MPNLKKAYYKFIGTLTNRPPWYVPMKVNPMGYRNEYAANHDLRLIDDLMRVEHGYMYDQHVFRFQREALIIYGRAGHPRNKFLIIGRKREGLCTVNDPFIDDTFYEGFDTIDEVYAKKGSVLNSQNWNFYKNDMFILGGIVNKRTFYLASKRTMANITEGNHLTIFGRELAGLLMAGYEMNRLSDGSEILTPAGGLNPLSIPDYNKRLPKFMDYNIQLAMIHKNLIRIDYIPETQRFRPIIANL